MTYHKIKVILVNLISYDYIVRYQAPLAVNILAGYLRSKVPGIEVIVIDMQDIFSNSVITGSEQEAGFNETIGHTVQNILQVSQNTPVIVGLSMKWATKDVAGLIIKKTLACTDKGSILFIVGNLLSTYGYLHLLAHPDFQDVLAVIGEGEDALVEITKAAIEYPENITNNNLYTGIANVAVRRKGQITMGGLERVNLPEYPPLTVSSAHDTYDKEWDVYAKETSRGCPWGKCTFCSIKEQFGSYRGFNGKADWGWKPFTLEKVFSDIDNYISQGALNFDIKDSEFFGPVRADGSDHFWDSMNRVEQFAHRFDELNKKFGATINHVSVRVDTVVKEGEPLKNIRRREVYELLSKAGLRGLYLGIESGSPQQLRRYCKGVTVEENKQAIWTLRNLGFNLEVGFIFFSPLDDLEDLHNNINFIEDTRLYETDSRIFGSLRVQEGTAYVDMLKNKGLLGRFQQESLSYSCRYQNDRVYSIKKLFDSWERATIKLVRLLPKVERLESYKINFLFLQDVLNAYYDNREKTIKEIVARYAWERSKLLNKVVSNAGGLLGEHLEFAYRANNTLLQ